MKVTFDAKSHTYRNTAGEQYISVTTLIKKYTPPFDENYWSAYKALKKVLTERGEYKNYCMKAGGWDFLVEYCRGLGSAFPYREEVRQAKADYLREWEIKRQTSAANGTAFHKAKEEEITKSSTFEHHELGTIAVLSGRELGPPDGSCAIYTEQLIYDHELKIAGQIDKLVKDDKTIFITDYKTSESIKKQSFRDERLLSPVDHIPNANYFTYGLQLSLYGYMAERKGYRVGDLVIDHVATGEQLAVPYMRSEVEAIVKHYLSESKRKR